MFRRTQRKERKPMTTNLLSPGDYADRILARIKKANASGGIHKNDVLYVRRTLVTLNQSTRKYWHKDAYACKDTLTIRAYVYGNEFVDAYAETFGLTPNWDL